MSEVSITAEDIQSDIPGQIMKLVKFAGQLDETNVDEKSKIIYQLIEQNPKGLNLIFDFELLEYMNSKSVGYITDWYSKITEAQGKIVICKAQPNIVDILSVVGLSSIIPMHATLDEAKLALSQGNAPSSPPSSPSSSPPSSPSSSPPSSPSSSPSSSPPPATL